MKTFWILWNPKGQTPPTVAFSTRDGAKNQAEKMQKQIGEGTMYVMRAEASYTIALRSKWEKVDGKL